MTRLLVCCALLCPGAMLWAMETLTFSSGDGLEMTADYYPLEAGAPLIVACHQAGWSRGEYRETAKWFNELGFAVLALDQRSGKEVNGVTNETAARATELQRGSEYLDALQDIKAAVRYAHDELEPSAVYLMGSSYSASLVLFLLGENALKVDGGLAFSPGEYFNDKQLIQKHAANIRKPVFITSAANEKVYWQEIAAKIDDTLQTTYLPESGGHHGSRALWTDKTGHEGYREAVRAFLATLE